jgi:hypothetical protein
MERTKFDNIVTNTLDKIQELLVVKGREYSRNDNPMHNFDKGVQRTGLIRERIIEGFALKHEISIDDMIEDMQKGKLPEYDVVEEKFNDAITYLLLKKASILDKLDEKKLPF